jgi:tRNA threonylcarbamoyladenosine biosynthesis protein TsaB
MAPVITLVLEASTYAGSVAVLRDGTLVAARDVAMRGREREALMPAVAELLAEQHVAPGALQRVVCGAGPGSFTSLRVAGSIAKGLALAAGCPLVPVSSLALVVASREPVVPRRYLAAIDALRGEHYVELFEVEPDGELRSLSPERRAGSAEVESMADAADAMAIGPDRHGVAHAVPRAAGAVRLSSQLGSATPADLGRGEPAYGRLAEAQVKWESAHGRPLEAV